MATMQSAILLTAESKLAKDSIKAAGGTWAAPLGGWVFTQEQRGSLLTAITAAGVAVTDLTSAASSASAAAAAPAAVPAVLPSVNASAALTVKAHKKAVLVTGETLKVKAQLSGLKGSWNRGLTGWIFPGSRRQEVVDFLRKDPTCTVVDEGGAPAVATKADDGDSSTVVKTDDAVKLEPEASSSSSAKPDAITASAADDDSEDDAPLTHRLSSGKAAGKPRAKPAGAPGSKTKAKATKRKAAPKAKRRRIAATATDMAVTMADGGPDKASSDDDFDEGGDDDDDDDVDEYDDEEEEGSGEEADEDAQDLAW